MMGRAKPQEVLIMCCGMGHIAGLTKLIQDEMRSGSYGGPAYGGGAYQKAYAPQVYGIEQGGLEQMAYGKTLVGYELNFDKEGNLTSAVIAYEMPGSLDQKVGYASPSSAPYQLGASQGPMLYDSESKEAIPVQLDSEGPVKTLASSNRQHWVIQPQALQREVIRDLFNKPTTEKIKTYGYDAQEEDDCADYTAVSALRNKIAQKKQEIGVKTAYEPARLALN